MAKISVLMPVYNVELYVAEALTSIQSQTFTDMEILIVDDGSTDSTRSIVERAAAADPRIKIIAVHANRGLPAALNLGLQYCRAPFIARMDGDDVALPTRLEKQLRLLEENPGIALVGCATQAIDGFGNPISGLGVSRKPVSEAEISKTMLLASPCLHIWLARREVYDTLSGYREISEAEDYDFLLRALSAGFRVTNLDESLMLIRKRPGNISSRLEQRKAHYYIAGLYRERMKTSQDSFSRKGYERAVKSGRAESGAYRLAMKCAQKGFAFQSRILRLTFLAISMLVSPWQARYFLDRIRFSAALRTAVPAR
ncbi:MAG: glycosyltransferase [Terracidiphilus sp.]|jgi:glycosyltransferase involved in cell wall biosynthesis